MNKIELVHYTNISNLAKILEIGKLLDQNDRAKHSDIKVGEGNFDRKLCKPTIEKVDIDKCDESYGVFFRVHVKDKKMVLPKLNQVAIVLKGQILKNKAWHLNYCENNGFLVRNNYIPFGDGRDTCPDSCNRIRDMDLSQIDQHNSEILIYKSVFIMNDNLVRIINNKNEDVVNVKSVIEKYLDNKLNPQRNPKNKNVTSSSPKKRKNKANKTKRIKSV